MFTIEARSVNEAAFKSLKLLTSSESYSYKSDKGQVNALDNVMIDITPNANRWLTLNGRNNSIMAVIGEIMWVMSGDNKVTGWLDKFLKRATLYCDDGIHWRAGYGKRLFAYEQIQTVIERLQKSPATRQAIASIYDPAQDSNMGITEYNLSLEPVPEKLDETKDMPCNNMLYFTVKENKLNLHVTARGLDWAWGIWSINYQEFTFLQEVVANILGYEVGTYNVYVNNLHLYTEVPVVNFQVSKVLNNDFVIDDSKYERTLDLGKVSTQYELNSLFSELIYSLNNPTEQSWQIILSKFNINIKSELGDWCRLIEAYFRKKNGEPFDLPEIYNKALKNAVMKDHFNSDLI